MAHWYSPDGTLVAQVPMSTKEGMRPTNISDARKLSLLPSVTTVMSILDKPMLNQWKVEQAVGKAIDGSYYGSRDEQIKAIVRDSEEYVSWAADFGTDVHAGIAHWLESRQWIGRPEVCLIVWAFQDWYTSQGFACEKAEHTFVSTEHGYASTLDWLGWWQGTRTLLDFKTQDFTEVRKAQFHDEFALQLAGYAVGIGEPDIQRASVVISRQVPGLVATKVWPDNEGDIKKWLAVWECWKQLKGWS